jgi:chitinase
MMYEKIAEFEQLVKSLKSNKVAVILSIGSSDGFDASIYSKMAKKDDSRDTFVSTVLGIVINYDLGGLLINWEYPVLWWVSKKSSSASFNFVDFSFYLYS